MQSNHRIGKNRRAEIPPALPYFALAREALGQFCLTSLWQRKFWCSSALLHFGKGSVGAVGTRGHFIPFSQGHVKAAFGAAVLALAGLFSRMNAVHLDYLRIYSALRLRILLLCLTLKILFG